MKSSELMKKEPKKSRLIFFIWLTRNILLGLVAFLLILLCYNKSPGYKWVYDTLLMDNMKYMKQYKDASLDERYEMKLGYTYAFLRYIKENTPDNAVILMPGKADIYFPKDGKTNFKGGEPTNILWLTRFLYPRKIVYDTDVNNKYAGEITYFAIINGWGYNKVPDDLLESGQDMLLPVSLK